MYIRLPAKPHAVSMFASTDTAGPLCMKRQTTCANVTCVVVCMHNDTELFFDIDYCCDIRMRRRRSNSGTKAVARDRTVSEQHKDQGHGDLDRCRVGTMAKRREVARTKTAGQETRPTVDPTQSTKRTVTKCMVARGPRPQPQPQATQAGIYLWKQLNLVIGRIQWMTATNNGCGR